MPNYLTMPKQQQILALLALGWSYRRIEAETGVRRETISRYDQRRANAAKTFPGSDRPPPGDAHEFGAPDDSKAAKTFAGSASNAAKPFLGSVTRPRFSATVYREAITEKLDAGLTHLARPGRGVRLRRELRVGEAIRTDDRADTSGRGGLSQRTWGGSAGRFLPRRPHARGRNRRMASPVGVSHDAGPLAARL